MNMEEFSSREHGACYFGKSCGTFYEIKRKQIKFKLFRLGENYQVLRNNN